jgi:RNA polymerase sigma factor (sigma-70 family)
MGRAVPKPDPLTPAQQALALTCHRLAFQLAIRRYQHHDGRVPREELESAALEGLCRGARRFDPGRGVKFVTYAHHAIRTALDRVVKVHLRRAAEHPLTDLALDDRFGWGLAEPPAPPPQEPADDLREQFGRVRSAVLRGAGHRCWRALWLYYVQGLRLRDVGRHIGPVTAERVRQLLRRALEAARAELGIVGVPRRRRPVRRAR